ncbi:serine protease [Rhizobium leguminosarum]|nr:serine protease [Rhizobium leguminosarum]
MERDVRLKRARKFLATFAVAVAAFANLAQAQEPGVADAVVYIMAGYDKDGTFVKVFEASGFLVNADGWIVTSRHLTEVAVPTDRARSFRAAVGSRTAPTSEVFDVPGPMLSSDVAMLRFSPALNKKWPSLKILLGSPNLSQAVEAYGFPLGQDVAIRPGAVTSLLGPNGTIQVNAGLAPGMSGGPVVINGTHCVIGVVAGGSGYPNYDFFTPVQSARPLLDQASATFAASASSQSSETKSFERSFQVDETKDDHGGSANSRDYQRPFDAEDGAEIVDARFEATSEAHSTDRSVVISGDRKSVTLKFRLESGPFYDQYRGWIHGQVVLVQRRKGDQSGSQSGCL